MSAAAILYIYICTHLHINREVHTFTQKKHWIFFLEVSAPVNISMVTNLTWLECGCVCVCELLNVLFGSKQWQSSPSLAAGCCEDLDSSILGTEALFYLDGNLQSLINYTLITQARLSGESVKNILFSLDITCNMTFLASRKESKYLLSLSYSGLSEYSAIILSGRRHDVENVWFAAVIKRPLCICVWVRPQYARCRVCCLRNVFCCVTPRPAHSCCAAHWAGAGRGLTYWERGVLAL